MKTKKEKWVTLGRSKGWQEYEEHTSIGFEQGSVVLNKSFGNMVVHFHVPYDITLKKNEKIILEARKLNPKQQTNHSGFSGLYKIPILNFYHLKNHKTVEEFNKYCASLDGKELEEWKS